METVEFEDGSALMGSDACVRMVRDDEGVTENAIPGHMYYDADGDPWIGCPLDGSLVNNDGAVPFIMPDTAMYNNYDELPTDMTGALFVAVLIGVAIFNRVRHARR